MSGAYNVDSRRITLKEYWNISPSWKVLIPWVLGRLNVPMPLGSGFRQPESVRELAVPEEAIDPRARAVLQPMVEEALALGFHSPRYYSFESLRKDVKTSFVSMLHSSGRYSVRLMHSLALAANPPVSTKLRAIMSELRDGTFLTTTDQKPRFHSPPEVVTYRLIGTGLSKLLALHQQQLDLGPVNKMAVSTPTLDSMDDLWDRYENRCFEFGLRRRLYQAMAESEVQQDTQVMADARAMTPATGEHEEVMVELSRLQNKKAGWAGTIWLLIISLVLFVAAGALQWDWSFVLILLPVLFFHELGHYVAMRTFRYRNLRMFFIPLFGAAVSGRHYNVPGWKKVVVSLMGPVPGIVLGAILGIAGWLLPSALLTKAAVVTLILNGFNLLPLLPLDGGWVFHALLFCRHWLPDTVFRVVAAIGLMVVGHFMGTKILLFLGIPMLMAVPFNYRLARIAHDLKKRGLTQLSPDDQNIPPETARIIIEEVKRKVPKTQTNKLVAQQTLQIFETLNARPPGWLATIGLLLTHVASFGLAVVLTVLFIMVQQGYFHAGMFPKVGKPERPVSCETISSWSGKSPGSRFVADTNTTTIIAHFKTPQAAQAAFAWLTNAGPADATITGFGQSVFLDLKGRKAGGSARWLKELRSRTRREWVSEAHDPALFSLTCELPDGQTADELERELSEHFAVDFSEKLIPPWYPGDFRTDEQRRAHRLARQTFQKARDAAMNSFQTPEVVKLREQLSAAYRKPDKAEAGKLEKAWLQLTAKTSQEEMERLKSAEGPIDPVTVDLYNDWSRNVDAPEADRNDTVVQELADRMGTFPVVNGTADRRYSSLSGTVSREGNRIRLYWLTFPRVAAAAPALLNWLCEKGAREIKYDVRSDSSYLPQISGEQ